MKKFIRSIFSTVDQFLKSRFILSVREAFIALLPYFVSSAVAILLLNTVTAFGWYQSDSGVVSRVKQGAESHTRFISRHGELFSWFFSVQKLWN
ncbi:hypothetical protein [Pseudoalteromonas xiamenensis]|uniref:Uncharacterized protein n=1 Tax=Pseudoalteromonas xiamenensis TaxID=882626 RepID=A0A975DGH8_9GAMM|nr:hypothetical protein [Pseudoalteromonas xiamenensis]QTH71431.1 hypothetical protein J5O05_16970 [Pseudoalteromonas xiamenensis]